MQKNEVSLFLVGSLMAGIIAVIFTILTGVFLIGCTVQQQHPSQPVTAAKQTATAERPSSQPAIVPAPVLPQQASVVAPPPEPVVWQPQYQPPPLPLPPAPSPVQTGDRRIERPARRVEIMGPGGKTLPHESGGKFTLYCTEFGTLTVRFPAGERLLEVTNGATGEWAIVPKTMGIDLPISVIGISRTPFAPPTEIQAITDAEIYQFILVPKSGGVSVQQASTFLVINPETEARRAEQRQRQIERAPAERQEREPEVPTLNPDQLRVYKVAGDQVPWMPLSVIGDNRRTVIQLPAGIATQPTFTVIQDGKEVRVNARSIVKQDGKGVRIVVDQPFQEARLIGAEGTVSIIGGGN